MPVPEFACRALRIPQHPSFCMGFLIIWRQEENTRRIHNSSSHPQLIFLWLCESSSLPLQAGHHLAQNHLQ